MCYCIYCILFWKFIYTFVYFNRMTDIKTFLIIWRIKNVLISAMQLK